MRYSCPPRTIAYCNILLRSTPYYNALHRTTPYYYILLYILLRTTSYSLLQCTMSLATLQLSILLLFAFNATFQCKTQKKHTLIQHSPAMQKVIKPRRFSIGLQMRCNAKHNKTTSIQRSLPMRNVIRLYCRLNGAFR